MVWELGGLMCFIWVIRARIRLLKASGRFSAGRKKRSHLRKMPVDLVASYSFFRFNFQIQSWVLFSVVSVFKSAGLLDYWTLAWLSYEYLYAIYELVGLGLIIWSSDIFYPGQGKATLPVDLVVSFSFWLFSFQIQFWVLYLVLFVYIVSGALHSIDLLALSET